VHLAGKKNEKVVEGNSGLVMMQVGTLWMEERKRLR
jgi:hypothetical protein